MTNYHILIIKTLPATNTNPAKVRIYSERFKEGKTIPFTNEVASISPTLETAENWLRKNGFELVGHAEGKDHYYVISSTFKTPKI